MTGDPGAKTSFGKALLSQLCGSALTAALLCAGMVQPALARPAAQEGIGEIGARFGVDYHEIARVNGIENPDLIYPGQVFTIPR